MSKADKLLKRAEFYEKMASSQKPENEDLLKKASLYERLALYSDRKSFLSAMAQPDQISQNEGYIRNTVSQLNNAIQSWIGSSAEKQADLPANLPGLPTGMRGPVQSIGEAMRSNQYNVDTLPALYQAARNIAYVGNLGNTGGDAKNAWMQTVFPQATRLIDLTGKQIKLLKDWKDQYGPEDKAPEDVGGNTYEFPANEPAKKPSLPTISRQDQQALLQFVNSEKLGTLDETKFNDGQLGKETRKALELVKDYFQKTYPQNPRMSDQAAITAAKAPKR